MQQVLAGRSGLLRLAVASLSVVVLVGPALARPTEPSATDRQIALAVSILMEQQHLTQRKIDDQASERCLQSMLKTLDPLKLYFYQSDVDEFAGSEHELDDMVRRGDIKMAYRIFDRFLQRVDERITMALKEVDVDHDFTLDEEMVRDADAATYAKTPEEAQDKWRRRVKYEVLNLIADDMDIDAIREKLRRRYTSIGKRWEQTSNDELMEMYLTAMTTGFDPHSTYMSPTTLDNFEIHMRLKLDGIGASLRSEDGYTKVHQIIAGGAADQDGRLKGGDEIVGVGQGSDGEIEDVVDMKLNDVVDKIRGKKGSIVRLEVRPAANPTDHRIYDIVRQEIKLTESEARSVIIDWGQKPNGESYKVGVLSLPSFYMDMDAARAGDPNYKSTTRDVRRLLNDFNAKGVDAVVIDLRFNGGGSLTEAVNMTGLFIDKGPVVQVKGPTGRAQPFVDPEAGMVWSGPLVVLTNKFSASASEIFAGAMQDYNRGLIVGDETTHGKGTVQQLYDVAQLLFRIRNDMNLGAMKLTIQQFYRPDGDSTQNRGVAADIVLPSLTSHLDIGEADLDYALAFNRITPLGHDEYQMVDANLVQQLQQNSTARIEKSEDFSDDIKRINKYEEQKDRKSVTLNKEKFMAERAELNADKEQEDAFEDAVNNDRPVFDDEDHYNQEALSIVVDYLKLLKNNRVAIAH
ncbi:carboxy terminal-processing peptidase [Aeoliella mucimassa]|uniref:Tail-specific protease n=1 Tax=Aeoliella mucimassa TaxID=2527972 RepID=A0A518ALP8_9BACT|nr:carboxy terminal-processing peptidase [Aeoliella mucimassa]QDU55624.1 Tail-specific protease precursor [Aeoliella mucimassa]